MPTTTPPSAANVLHYAFEYRDYGFSFLPLSGKRPRLPSWKELTECRPTHGEIVAWFGDLAERKAAPNIGIICGRISRVVVLDADDEETAALLALSLPATEMRTRTAKGIHFYYQITEDQIVPPRVRIAGLQLDVRGEGSYAVAPPSIHPTTGKPYEKIGSWNLVDVPYFDLTWFDRLATNREPTAMQGETVTRSVRDGPAYIANIRAIAGQGGHNATFRAACKLRDAGLSEAEALAALVEWNATNAEPPWSIRELLHKVTNAYQRGSPTPGFR